MKPENLNQDEGSEPKINPLYQVTPVSKYLAIALFIILPFVGAWMGYQYALDTKIKVEGIITESKVQIVEEHQYNQVEQAKINNNLSESIPDLISVEELSEGQQINGLTVASIDQDVFGAAGESSYYVNYLGEMVITGVTYGPVMACEIGLSLKDSSLPVFTETYNEFGNYSVCISEESTAAAQVAFAESGVEIGDQVTLRVKDYIDWINVPKGGGDTVTFIELMDQVQNFKVSECPFENNGGYLIKDNQLCYGDGLVLDQVTYPFMILNQSTKEAFTVNNENREEGYALYAYGDDAFYIAGKPTYTSAGGDFEMYGGGEFIRIQDRLYGWNPAGLNRGTLKEIQSVDVDDFEYIESYFGKDGNHVFHAWEPGSFLELADPDTFQPTSIIDGELVPPYLDHFGIDGERLYYRGTLMTGLNYSGVISERDFQVIYDSDHLWRLTGGCNWPYYIEGELDKKDEYYNC